tara:strand:- start:206 stop:436 length:231 start_codon:yes stop_codon:yes gene_type:complete
MNILITGCAGFIGYNLSEHLLDNKRKIIRLDNFDEYYSVALKIKKIDELKKNKNFLILKYFFKKYLNGIRITKFII